VSCKVIRENCVQRIESRVEHQFVKKMCRCTEGFFHEVGWDGMNLNKKAHEDYDEIQDEIVILG
jgi:hypothetical protein